MIFPALLFIAALSGPDYTRANEGCVLVSYHDTTGHRTIGIGHRQMNDDHRARETNVEAERQYDEDYKKAIRAVETLQVANGVTSLPLRARLALQDMAFQLGAAGLGGFHRMWSALASGDYDVAAFEIITSRYAQQCPERARKNARLTSDSIQ